MIVEIVIASGKGGTGKTTIAAACAHLAAAPVIADCDVDASDLHLVLAPRVIERHEFRGGFLARVDPERCSACGACLADCRFGAIRLTSASANGGGGRAVIDPRACEGCGVCARFCPAGAIDLVERVAGEWLVSETACGPMVHARLAAGAENSGKLVSIVRENARRIAAESGRSLILVDGPPGIGCPVIAAVTGASLLLAVTEPTVSGEHDLERLLALARHFSLPAAVCVNRWDVNEERTESIERLAAAFGAIVAGRVRYDPEVTRAQVAGVSVTEHGGAAAEEIASVWERLAKEAATHGLAG